MRASFLLVTCLTWAVASRPLAILLARRPEDLAVDSSKGIAFWNHFTVLIFFAGARCKRDDDIASQPFVVLVGHEGPPSALQVV